MSKMGASIGQLGRGRLSVRLLKCCIALAVRQAEWTEEIRTWQLLDGKMESHHESSPSRRDRSPSQNFPHSKG